MPSLKDLRNRISSVKSTKKITSAMKMVAAAKLKRAQDNAEKSRPYATEILKQPQYTPLKVEEQVVVIFSGVKGFLDKIEISEITKFESFLLKKLRNQGKDILKTIKDQKSLSEETETKLNQFLESTTNEFLQ